MEENFIAVIGEPSIIDLIIGYIPDGNLSPPTFSSEPSIGY